MASGFSRLQLAAALLEYDNDPENPHAPHRSAHESAIFAHLRRNVGTRIPTAPRTSDYLDVSIPGESASAGQRGSIAHTVRSRGSRGSIDALRNPFGADDHLESEEEVERDGIEVDLASWGLDAFMPKDKAARNGKGKAKSTDIASPHSVSSVPSHQPLTSNDAIATSPRRALGASRSMSVGGNLEYFGIEKAVLERQRTHRTSTRRRSMGSPLDFAGLDIPQIPIQRRRASESHTLIQTSSYETHSIPFPTTAGRSPSPTNEPGTRYTTQIDTTTYTHERVLSNTSLDSKILLKDDGHSVTDRARRMSNATMATVAMPTDDNPFALRPPSRASRFDPKAAAHARTISNASLGSRFLLDGDGASIAPGQVRPDLGERRYSTTLDLLRPKVLVMPSPLQPPAPPAPSPNENFRGGFQLSADGPPLPPGARSARRASATLSTIQPPPPPPPNPSNSFTPNPLITLSLSQLTFRDTLPIGDQRSSMYIEGNLPRATEDGDQAQFDGPEPEDAPTPALQEMEDFKTGRPAGKLYGKSLIDDLESRKAQMRSKQRVFTGDQRPSMMARGSQQRTSTLIDPSTLQPRPVSQHIDSFGSQGSQQALGRRNSANIKPLLSFDHDDKLPQPSKPPLIPNSRSVFGVDTLWESEMVKLKQIELREKAENEERKKREEAYELKKGKKKKRRKDKSKLEDALEPQTITPSDPTEEVEPRVSAEPPTLPNIQQAPRKVPPPIGDDDDSESDGSQDAGPSGTQVPQKDWYAGSSDEEDRKPRRTTGSGPRYSAKQAEDNSDDDVPLAATVNRRTKHLRPPTGGESDDERPLSTLVRKNQTTLPNINFDNLFATKGQADEDDDQPLGLRVSRLGSSLAGGLAGEDDDRPLAFHPEQQRRSQYQMMAQQQHQQQQQQQMMMQAQMQNSMFFSPPSMGSPYFGPSMMPMMMQSPMQIPSAAPMHDEAKYGRVDRWRRDVAVEGEP